MIPQLLAFLGRKRFNFIDLLGLSLLALGFNGAQEMSRGGRFMAFFLAFGLFGISTWLTPKPPKDDGAPSDS